MIARNRRNARLPTSGKIQTDTLPNGRFLPWPDVKIGEAGHHEAWTAWYAAEADACEKASGPPAYARMMRRNAERMAAVERASGVAPLTRRTA